MIVELRIYNSYKSDNPGKEYETIKRAMPTSWPIPRSGDYITLHTCNAEDEQQETFLNVNSTCFVYHDTLKIERILITAERV